MSLEHGAVRLRPVERDDVPQLRAWELDHASWALQNDEPYTPRSLHHALERFDAGRLLSVDDKHVPFAVEANGSLVGSVALWGIDVHNRSAHLGIGLGPDARGKGYGRTACRLLLRHAFLDRGLHRVQLEVLVDNAVAVRAYEAAGFVHEGRLREHAWVLGRFVDSYVMSVLAPQWSPPTG